jgi:hypothetical protein
MADVWTKVGIGVQAAGALLVSVSLLMTACQISAAREATQATTVYNLEKDFSDRFAATGNPEFGACFGPQPPAPGGFKVQDICTNTRARQEFFDLLAFYRLLLDLRALRSLQDVDVSARIKAACPYLAGSVGRATIAEFQAKGLVRPDLSRRIGRECGSS